MKHEEYGSSNSCTDLFMGKEISHMNIARFFIPIGSVHGTFTSIWFIFMVNVGKYASPMDPMGYISAPKNHPCFNHPSDGWDALPMFSDVSWSRRWIDYQTTEEAPLWFCVFFRTVDGRNPAPPGMVKTL